MKTTVALRICVRIHTTAAICVTMLLKESFARVRRTLRWTPSIARRAPVLIHVSNGACALKSARNPPALSIHLLNNLTLQFDSLK